MKSMGTIESALKTLGLRPGATTQEIEQAYCHLRRRYSIDCQRLPPRTRRWVAHRLLEIDAAHNALRGHDSTASPRLHSLRWFLEKWNPPRDHHLSVAPRPDSPLSSVRVSPATETTTTHPKPEASVPRWVLVIGSILILRLVVYIIDSPKTDQHPRVLLLPSAPSSRFPALPNPTSVAIPPAPAPTRVPVQPPSGSKPNRFTVGSSKQDVMAVQGRPTAISDYVWQYGRSVVYFEGDKVTHWEERSGAPLKVRPQAAAEAE
jgi:hypothetical protein